MITLLLFTSLVWGQINVSSPKAMEIYDQAKADETKVEKEEGTKEKNAQEDKAEDQKDNKKEDEKTEKKDDKKSETQMDKKDKDEASLGNKEELKKELKEEVKKDIKSEIKEEIKSEVKAEMKEETKEPEPTTTTTLPSNYGASYGTTTPSYSAPQAPVKIKDISGGQQTLPSYGTPPTGTTPALPYGTNPSKQKMNPYMP